ncbi:MAG TPA: hypothetical protein VFW73_12675 [Lacipirellulaceae bacterium]|nr:hypothetical protein [Lacipirellulaceae bacterium]
MIFTGCATWQGPRIDPTGEQLFVWPNPTPIVAAPPAPAPGVVSPSPAAVGPPTTAPSVSSTIVSPSPVPPGAPLPFGNVQAPPVYSDPPTPPIAPTAAAIPPVAPTPYVPAPVTPSLPAATVSPSVPIEPPVAGQPAAASVPPGHGFVRLTPDHFVAPVGSEVLLKAGVVGTDGSLTPNQRVEWSVARTGVGQLGDMALHSPIQLFGWWQAPERTDNWSAVGTTAWLPVTLDANAADPNRTWRVERGETWVTVASGTEGTSQVTAYAPDQPEFNQATATIYWIDAQWAFPPSAIAEVGKPYILTTSVMRRTNGAPLAGWVVRYTVGTGGSLGYEGGNSTDVTTDATGRASIEVSPTGTGAGVATVGIAIIRPQSIGPSALPNIELSRSAATITWGAGTVPAAPLAPAVSSPTLSPTPLAPPPAVPAPTTTPLNQPAPSLPPSNAASTSPPPQYTPPATPATGHPRLEISLRATGPEQVAVGEYVEYELTITNRGDGVAQHIEVRDRFDPGLRSPGVQNTHLIKNANIRDLVPNESQTIKLPFQVIAPGQQCHDVAVAADGVEPVGQHACVTGLQASLNVKVTAPVSRVVGETVQFSVAVKNVAASAAANVEIRFQCDTAIDLSVEQGIQRLPDGSLLVRLDRGLAANEQRVFPFHGQCKVPSDHVCARATVTALGGVNSVDEACFQILPALSGAVPGH